MKVSIIIPVYNEEKRIGDTLNKICEYFRDTDYEVIVADDGSIDNIILEVEKYRKVYREIYIVSNKTNRGKGVAVKQGTLQSKGEYILVTDADLSASIEEIVKLLFWLRNGYDISIGSRGVATSLIEYPESIVRQTMGKTFNLFVQLLLSLRIKDTQCGFKCFKRKPAILLFEKLRIERFAFDVEILYLAKLMGYKIKEVGIKWSHSQDTKIHLLRDGIRMVADTIKIFIYGHIRIQKEL